MSDFFRRTRNIPELRMVKHFHDHPAYIAALAEGVRKHWAQHGKPDKLLMSFHGLPRYTLERGDPYHCECQKTARLLAEALALTPEQYQLSFQSRFGRAEWLQPYTAATLAQWGKQGLRRVDVVCPGFVADCLETLEEIGMEGKAEFLKAGGKEFHAIPCLNESDAWIQALAQIALEHLRGWDERRRRPRTNWSARARARALGAPPSAAALNRDDARRPATRRGQPGLPVARILGPPLEMPRLVPISEKVIRRPEIDDGGSRT